MATDRRRFLRNLAGVALGVSTSGVLAAPALTPRQSAGPFYPPQPPLDDDSDLVHVAGQTGVAKGQIAELSGRLLDRNGRPLRATRIEIWQCDANGRYRHPRDPGSQAPDPGFQGFGHTLTDDLGRYRFLTIRPVPYPGRTPHIHVAVFADGEPTFVTQLYVADEPLNADDFLYRRIPVEQRTLVSAVFEPATGGVAALRARWDIVLGIAQG